MKDTRVCNPVVPPSRPWSWRDGRWFVLVLVPTYIAVFLFLSSTHSSIDIAHRWGVSTMQPVYSDLYVIPAAVAVQRAGGNPYVANPADPFQRPLNYPAIWLRLSGSDMSPTAIRRAAIAMFAACLAAMLAFLGPLNWRAGVLVTFFSCSPPILLAVQRANIDLLILAIVAASLSWLRNRHVRTAWLGYAGLSIAAFLKLFPLATALVVVREPQRRRKWAAVGAILVCTVCLAVNWPELHWLVANTAQGLLDSYGSHILARWIEGVAPVLGWSVAASRLEPLTSVAAVAVLLVALWYGARDGIHRRVSSESIDGLRAGAAIYVSTFLLGSNFDYRLAFLFLCLPALFDLGRPDSGLRGWSVAALVLMAASLWLNGFIIVGLGILQTLCTWALLVVLIVIVTRTLEWRSLFPIRIRNRD